MAAEARGAACCSSRVSCEREVKGSSISVDAECGYSLSQSWSSLDELPASGSACLLAAGLFLTE